MNLRSFNGRGTAGHVERISVDCILDVFALCTKLSGGISASFIAARKEQDAGMIDEMVEIEVKTTHRYQGEP